MKCTRVPSLATQQRGWSVSGIYFMSYSNTHKGIIQDNRIGVTDIDKTCFDTPCGLVAESEQTSRQWLTHYQ